MIARILGYAALLWIAIWVVWHPAETGQILHNIGSVFSLAKH